MSRYAFINRTYRHLALANIFLVLAIAVIEVVVPNASRLTSERWRDSSLEFIPAYLTWDVRTSDGAFPLIFSYPVLLLLAAAMSIALILVVSVHSGRVERAARVVQTIENRASLEIEFGQTKHSLRALSLAAETVIYPAVGATFITLICWLICTVVAGKLDPAWTRPFLAPPMLVAQNLQFYAGKFWTATIRSSWHMAQAVVFGTALGILGGFFLSQVKGLHRWTQWHLTIVSALPPFMLAEIFKQIVQTEWFPVFGKGEPAFKLGICMATWAVLWPVLSATALAISSIDPEYRRSTRLLGARSAFERLRHVELPFIIPPVLTNLRVGFVIGLIVLTYGESYGSPRESCLGYWFSETTNYYRLQSLLALLFFMSLLVIAFEAILKFVERTLLPYKFAEARAAASSPFRPSAAEEKRSSLEAYEQARSKVFPKPVWLDAPWTTSEHFFAVDGVRKSYGDVQAFYAPELRHAAVGEFVSVIGKSGQGKSTFMKLLLGFEEADASPTARLSVDGLNLLDHDSFQGTAESLSFMVSYVSQRSLLLPHLTVEHNILFGLRRGSSHRSPYRSFHEKHVEWLLNPIDSNGSSKLTPHSWKWPTKASDSSDTTLSPLGMLIRFMGLADKMSNYPGELSGGEAQRVHLLRWLILERPILMLDEAFSALDQPLKAMVRDAIHRNAKAFGTSVLNVSHDRADVLQISDRILFIDKNEIRAYEPPTKLFFSPKTSDLAIFLGNTNLFSIERTTRNVTELRVTYDVYRSSAFNTPMVLHVKNPVEADVSRVFIPRSDINIDRISQDAPTTDFENWFRIESVRFTGTHYDVRMHRDNGDSVPLRLDCVVQDDELSKLLLLHKLEVWQLPQSYACVTIERGIRLPGVNA